MTMNKSAYLAWQAPKSREWHVVGLLSETDEGYLFAYTNGAKASEKFIPFSGMENMDSLYRSEELFPLFHNRLLSKKRPEYPKFIEWMGLIEGEVSPVSILGRSGAIRGTDKLQMFSRVEVQQDGSFEHIFFAHGLSYFNEMASERVSQLQVGERLFLCPDPQNEYDCNAVLMRADKPKEAVGYLPRFLAKDIVDLLKESPDNIQVFVESVSDEAPLNYRLQCRLVGCGGANEKTFMTGDEYRPIVVSKVTN